jgi:hypothetical protein
MEEAARAYVDADLRRREKDLRSKNTKAGEANE